MNRSIDAIDESKPPIDRIDASIDHSHRFIDSSIASIASIASIHRFIDSSIDSSIHRPRDHGTSVSDGSTRSNAPMNAIGRTRDRIDRPIRSIDAYDRMNPIDRTRSIEYDRIRSIDAFRVDPSSVTDA